MNDVGEGDEASVTQTPLVAPGNPRSLRVIDGNTFLTVTWSAPSQSAGALVASYDVQYRTVGANSWTDVSRAADDNSLTQQISGLNNGQTYEVQVSAVNRAGRSAWVSARGAPRGTAPGVPRSLDVVERDRGLSASWLAPANDGGSPITSYSVRHKPVGATRWTNASRSGADDSTSQLITGLTNRQHYDVEIAAVNRIGTGGWASASGTPQAPPDPPVDPADADADLNVGALGGSWTDGPGTDNFHTDSHGLNVIFACYETQHFRVFWRGPGDLPITEANPAADQWQAHLITRSGAGVVTHQFRPEYSDSRFTGLYGSVKMHGYGFITVRVRGQFDGTWGTWSPPMGFYCLDPDTHPARNGQTQRAPEVNQPATGKPAITGSTQVGQTLTASTAAIADPDGITNATLSYQWSRDNGVTTTEITGATSDTYTVLQDDVNTQLSVTVSFTDDAGFDESLTSLEVLVQAPQPLYGGFDATTVPGEHEGAETTFTFEIHFNQEPSLGYANVRDHVLNVTNGAVTGASRTTPGSNIRWEITLEPNGDDDVTVVLPPTTDCDDQSAVCTQGGQMLSNSDTITVPGPAQTEGQQGEGDTPVNTAATGRPAITGTAQVGETLTASTSGIADEDGLDNAVFSYQWIRNDGSTDSGISGVTGSTYVLNDADEGKSIKVRVSFSDDAGNQESLTSAATASVGPKPNSPATSAPSITGTARVGETLTADNSGIADADGLDNATFSYQWLADDSDIGTAIAGATGSTYTLADADESKTIRVRVSFTDDRGHAETLTSAATAAVAGLPPLTASFEATPSSHDGQTAFTFQLRFSEEVSLSYKTLRDHAFTVTGGTVNKAKRLEKSSNIRWQITVEPASDASVTVVLPVTTDCNAQGAICTEDGRKPSNRNEFTVSGVGG